VGRARSHELRKILLLSLSNGTWRGASTPRSLLPNSTLPLGGARVSVVRMCRAGVPGASLGAAAAVVPLTAPPGARGSTGLAGVPTRPAGAPHPCGGTSCRPSDSLPYKLGLFPQDIPYKLGLFRQDILLSSNCDSVDQVRPLFGELLRAALRLVVTCTCEEAGGCPACLQTSQSNCSLYNEGLDKAASAAVLRATLVAEQAQRPGHSPALAR
jgi:hypothetical protein